MPPVLRRSIAVYEAGRVLLGYITPNYDEISQAPLWHLASCSCPVLAGSPSSLRMFCRLAGRGCILHYCCESSSVQDLLLCRQMLLLLRGLPVWGCRDEPCRSCMKTIIEQICGCQTLLSQLVVVCHLSNDALRLCGTSNVTD